MALCRHRGRRRYLQLGGFAGRGIFSERISFNASKAWITGAWLYIPLTLATQIALIPYTDFSSVSGVLIFNLLSSIPNLLLNAALSYRGFRSLQLAST